MLDELGGWEDLGGGLADADRHVLHLDRHRHVRQRRELRAIRPPCRAVDVDEEDGHAVADCLDKLEAAPGRGKVGGREEDDERLRVAHSQLQRGQLDQVVPVDEGAVAEIREPVVHARHNVLRLRALMGEEGVVADGALSQEEVCRRLPRPPPGGRCLTGPPQTLPKVLKERVQVRVHVVERDRVTEDGRCGVARLDEAALVGLRGLGHVGERGERHPSPRRPLDRHGKHLHAVDHGLAEFGAAGRRVKVRLRDEADHAAGVADALLLRVGLLARIRNFVSRRSQMIAHPLRQRGLRRRRAHKRVPLRLPQIALPDALGVRLYQIVPFDRRRLRILGTGRA